MIPTTSLPERLVPSNGPKWEIRVAHRLDEIMQVISLRARVANNLLQAVGLVKVWYNNTL